ncbi:MAG: ion transporter [Bdellovibrionota bacterium]
MSSLAIHLKKVSLSPLFRNTIMLVIVIAGVAVGLETYPSIMESHGVLLRSIDWVVHVIFVIEIIIRIGAHGSKPLNFFKDSWNVFDFIIVAACVLPVHIGYLAVFRLVRVLRVLRLVSALPRLQLLVGALLKSIPSLGYITILLGLFFYVYACIGTVLFAANDPMHFGTLHNSFISLFQIVTLEDWADIFYIQFYGADVWGYDFGNFVSEQPTARPVAAVFFFFSFILFGTMIILNLFIGVILNGMLEMATEAEAYELEQKRQADTLTLGEELHLLLSDVENIKGQLQLIRKKLN